MTRLKWKLIIIHLYSFGIKKQTGYKDGLSSPDVSHQSQVRSVIRLHPSASDNGMLYTCVAQHPALANVTSASFASDRPTPASSARSSSRRLLFAQTRLNVLFPPERPTITGQPASGMPLKAGTSINLVCQSAGGNPQPQLIWMRNGQQVDSSYETTNGLEVVNSYSFVVTPTDHNALFKCVARPSTKSEPLARLLDGQFNFFPSSQFFFPFLTCTNRHSPFGSRFN
jgi:hypothetical protein